MTGKENLGREAWSQINTSFTKAENELFDEGIDPANARSWTEIAGDIVKGVGKVAGVVGKRPERSGGVYTRLGSPYVSTVTDGNFDYVSTATYGNARVDKERVPFYRAIFNGDVSVKEVGQNVLKWLTNIYNKSVDGAYNGKDIYVYKNLSENQKEATKAHEIGHAIDPDASEERVETDAGVYSLHLAKNDPSPYVRTNAWKAFNGVLETARNYLSQAA